MVVIEHDTKFIFTLCDRVLVLVQGELLVEGARTRCAATRGWSRPTSGAPPEEVEAQLHEVVGDATAAHEAPSTGGAHRRRDDA